MASYSKWPTVERAEQFLEVLSDEGLINTYAQIVWGAMYNDKKNWRKAYEINLIALQMSPDDPLAAANNVFYLWRLNRHSEAISFAKGWLLRGLEADPHLHQGMGHALYALGRYAEAEQSYRLAHQMVPSFPNYVRDIVRALATQGRTDEAVAFGRAWLSEHREAEDEQLDMVRRAIADAWSKHVRRSSDIGDEP